MVSHNETKIGLFGLAERYQRAFGDVVVIRSFADERTRTAFDGQHPKGSPADSLRVARRKLNYRDAATSLDALTAPPGNKLHPLLKDGPGQHAIWINDQFRLCFRRTETGPEDVEIVGYY